MLTPLLVDETTGYGVYHDDPFLTAFGSKLLGDGQDEHAFVASGYLHFPIPVELQNTTVHDSQAAYFACTR